MNEREIDGNQFLSMLAGGLNGLKAVADEINDLNVFPIPDGDTGDNMVSTMAGGVQASASLKSLSCGEGYAPRRARQLGRNTFADVRRHSRRPLGRGQGRRP